LNRAAVTHSKFQAARKRGGHDGPGGNMPWDRARAEGLTTGMVSENAAVGARDAVGVMQQWMKSAGHRANILAKGYTLMGFGQEGSYSTQMFSQGGGSGREPRCSGGSGGSGGPTEKPGSGSPGPNESSTYPTAKEPTVQETQKKRSKCKLKKVSPSFSETKQPSPPPEPNVSTYPTDKEPTEPQGTEKKRSKCKLSKKKVLPNFTEKRHKCSL
jgi:hypothetical protein